MSFTVSFTKEELPALRVVLDRAMNCLEPQLWPTWIDGLSRRVDEALGNPMPAIAVRGQP